MRQGPRGKGRGWGWGINTCSSSWRINCCNWAVIDAIDRNRGTNTTVFLPKNNCDIYKSRWNEQLIVRNWVIFISYPLFSLNVNCGRGSSNYNLYFGIQECLRKPIFICRFPNTQTHTYIQTGSLCAWLTFPLRSAWFMSFSFSFESQFELYNGVKSPLYIHWHEPSDKWILSCS